MFTVKLVMCSVKLVMCPSVSVCTQSSLQSWKSSWCGTATGTCPPSISLNKDINFGDVLFTCGGDHLFIRVSHRSFCWICEVLKCPSHLYYNDTGVCKKQYLICLQNLHSSWRLICLNVSSPPLPSLHCRTPETRPKASSILEKCVLPLQCVSWFLLVQLFGCFQLMGTLGDLTI